jgi:hypothetical protein
MALARGRRPGDWLVLFWKLAAARRLIVVIAIRSDFLGASSRSTTVIKGFIQGEARANRLLDPPFRLRLAIHQQGCRAAFSYATAAEANCRLSRWPRGNEGCWELMRYLR